MEIKEILEELSVFGDDRPLPRQALAEAVRQKEAITPVLLDTLDTVCQRVLEEGEDIYDDPVYAQSFYALFLLAQFREKKAFPKLLRMLTLGQENTDIVLGEDSAEYVPKLLYSTYDGNFSGLKSIISDDHLYPFFRGSALEALDGLLYSGQLSREELIAFLRERLAALGEGEDEEIFGALLVSLIADCDLFELTEDVREAYRQEKVDLMHLGEFESFFDYLYNETGEDEHIHPVEDAAQELGGWSCFQSSEPSRLDILSWKAGRNDPCPCGSGKKFKKCCLPKQEEMKLRFSSIDFEKDWDRYPPVERQGDRPGLSDFYAPDALEVDHLAYRAFLLLEHPGRQEQKGRRRYVQARDLLWEAFEKFRKICQEKGLDTPEAYDREHKVHYYCRKWLNTLSELLEDAKDERYQEVQAVL